MFLVVTLTIAIFVVLFINVAISPKVCKVLLGTTGAVAFIGGLFFYGAIFAEQDVVMAVAKTCYVTCMQFLGESPYELLQDTLSEYADRRYELTMTILCFCGLFTTAGTAIAAIGSKFLAKLRVRFRASTPLAVIRPLNNETLEFARELVEDLHQAVVFVDPAPDPAIAEAAEDVGKLCFN